MSSASRPISVPERILHRLDWQVIRRLDGLLQGDYRTLFYGAGIDFSDLREYQPQDDIRHIDWNVTARMDAPYVRQYVEDREITAWFLLDLTPSMGFGPLKHPKKAILVDFVATLARLLTRSGNKVGAIIYDGEAFLPIPPRTGKNQVLRLIREILEFGSRKRVTTRLDLLLSRALETITRRSLVFILSDFISESDWDRPLLILGRRHECIACRLWDPLEYELPDIGLVLIEDLETGAQLRVNTGDMAFRRRFEEAADRQEIMIHEKMRAAGIDLFGISTADSVIEAIVRMAKLRKKRRRT